MAYQREHPIRILTRTSYFFLLLLLPVLRGLFYSGGNFYVWLSGAWIDLLVVATIVFLSYLVWYFDLYRVGEEGLYVYRGIFQIKKQFLSFSQLSSVVIERPWYYRPFGAVRLRADTNGGSSRSFDLSIILSRHAAVSLFRHASSHKNPEGLTLPGKTYKTKLAFVAVLSLISSNTLTGILFATTLISQSGQIFGAEFEQLVLDNLTQMSQLVILGIPPIAITISLLVLAGWIIAFSLNLVRYAKFSILRNQKTLLIHSGVWINRRSYLLDIQKINLVELRQTIFTKICRFYTVYLDCIGYGKAKNEKNVFIPAASRGSSLRVLCALLPEIKFVRPSIRPRSKDFRFFLTIPLLEIGILLVAVLILCRIFPAFSELIIFFGAMLEILFCLFLIMKILSFYQTAIGYQEGVYTLHCTRGFLFSRMTFPVQKLSKICIRQTPFQKLAGCCTVVFYTFSEKRKRHVVPNLPMDACKKLLYATINDSEKDIFKKKD